MKRRHAFILTGVLGLGLAQNLLADPPALALATQGDDYVGVQSKDKVIHIFSDKSMGTVAPTVWHVQYYDPDSTLKCVEVKFGAGKELEVSHPIRPFQLPANSDDVLDRSRLKVDSDQALHTATSQPPLKPLTLKASKLTLTHSDAGPVWKVQLWAAKQSDPSTEAEVGTVTISALDGTVLKADLHPGKAE